MKSNAAFQGANTRGSGKSRVLWFPTLAAARAEPRLFDLADAIEVSGQGVFFASRTSTATDDGTEDALAIKLTAVAVGRFIRSVVYSPSIVTNTVNGVQTIGAAAGDPRELIDFLGASIAVLEWYRPDPAHITRDSSGSVPALVDRIGGRIAAQNTLAKRPTWEPAFAPFGGRPAITDGGAGVSHAKRLTCVKTQNRTTPHWNVTLFAATSNVTASARLIGTGTASRTNEIYFDANGTIVNTYNGGAGSVSEGFDPTSRLAYLAISMVQAQGSVSSRGVLYRSDGKMWHREAMNNLEDIATTGISLLGWEISETQGFPGALGDHIVGTGVLDTKDVAAICEYAHKRYAFARPARELTFHGDSKMVRPTLWPDAIVLAGTDVRYFTAVGSLTTQQSTAHLDWTAKTQQCMAPGVRRGVVTDIGTLNAIPAYIGAGYTVAAAVAAVRQDVINHVAALKAAGYVDVYATNSAVNGTYTANMQLVSDQFNALFAAEWASWGIKLPINVGTATAVNGQVAPAALLNSADVLYFTDTVHHTAAGYVIFGEQIRQVVASDGW